MTCPRAKSSSSPTAPAFFGRFLLSMLPSSSRGGWTSALGIASRTRSAKCRVLAWLLAFTWALVGWASVSSSQQFFPDKYDREIERAVSNWWPDLPDWQLWKAQLYQESRLRPDAVSPVGARGLAQFMPGTWSDMVKELRLGAASPHDAAPAIQAGAYYMAKLRRTWKANRPMLARHDLALASYNAGTGNLLRAQDLCGGARLWAEIAPCLGKVTGQKNAHETRTYVERIAKWRMMMGGSVLAAPRTLVVTHYWHDHRPR